VSPSAPVKVPVRPRSTSHVALHPLGLDEVRITGGFWGDWQRDNRDVSVPHAARWLERDGTVDNLRRLDGGDLAAPHRGFWFSDSDVYKVLEAVSWDLGRGGPSTELSELVRKLVEVLAGAQEPGGYINSFVQAGFDVRWEIGRASCRERV